MIFFFFKNLSAKYCFIWNLYQEQSEITIICNDSEQPWFSPSICVVSCNDRIALFLQAYRFDAESSEHQMLEAVRQHQQKAQDYRAV